MEFNKSPEQRIDEANRELAQAFQAAGSDDQFLAWTGRNDTAKTVLVANRPGFIYIRIPRDVEDGEMVSYSEHMAYSPTEQKHGIPVIVARSPDNPAIYVVKGRWNSGIGGSNTNPNIQPHRTSHELFHPTGGSDPVMVVPEQIDNLQIVPTSPPSESVMLKGGWFVGKDGVVRWVNDMTIDLSANIPVTADRNFVSLWYKISDGTITKTTKVQTSPGFAQTIPNLHSWPTDDSYVPLALVRLVQDDVIRWSTNKVQNIFDMRPKHLLMSGVGPHPLNPDYGYHTGTLPAHYVTVVPTGTIFTGTNVQDILFVELGPERARVKATSADQGAGFLSQKLSAGSGIQLDVINAGSYEQVRITATGSSGGGGDESYIKIVDRQNFEDPGGTFTQDAWQTRRLTDIDFDTGGRATLLGNVITLEAGTYRCQITCPAYKVYTHTARLHDVTNDVTLLYGTAEYAGNGEEVQTFSMIVGEFTLDEDTDLEIQHYCLQSKTTYGFGVPLEFPDNTIDSVYTVAEFWTPVTGGGGGGTVAVDTVDIWGGQHYVDASPASSGLTDLSFTIQEEGEYEVTITGGFERSSNSDPIPITAWIGLETGSADSDYIGKIFKVDSTGIIHTNQNQPIIGEMPLMYDGAGDNGNEGNWGTLKIYLHFSADFVYALLDTKWSYVIGGHSSGVFTGLGFYSLSYKQNLSFPTDITISTRTASTWWHPLTSCIVERKRYIPDVMLSSVLP